MDAGKVILQLSVEFAHFGLGYAEVAHLFRKDDAGIRISGIGAQVISASFALMVSSTISTPAKVARFVMVSGIIWA